MQTPVRSQQLASYDLPPNRKIILLCILGAIELPLLALSIVGGEPAGVLAALVVALILGPIAYVAAWRYPRLVLREEGIELQQLGWRVSTTWENVAQIVRSPSPGLILREPLEGRGATTLAASNRFVAFYGPMGDALVRERRWFPLDPFAYWMDRGDLSQQLSQHAPPQCRRLSSLLLPSPWSAYVGRVSQRFADGVDARLLTRRASLSGGQGTRESGTGMSNERTCHECRESAAMNGFFCRLMTAQASPRMYRASSRLAPDKPENLVDAGLTISTC